MECQACVAHICIIMLIIFTIKAVAARFFMVVPLYQILLTCQEVGVNVAYRPHVIDTNVVRGA